DFHARADVRDFHAVALEKRKRTSCLASADRRQAVVKFDKNLVYGNLLRDEIFEDGVFRPLDVHFQSVNSAVPQLTHYCTESANRNANRIFSILTRLNDRMRNVVRPGRKMKDC